MKGIKKLHVTIDIHWEYVIVGYQETSSTTQTSNQPEVIKINGNEQIPIILSFDINGNPFIGKNQSENTYSNNTFIQHLLNNPTERKKQPIEYLGKKIMIDDICLMYFFMKELVKQVEEKGIIETMMITIPENS